MWALIFITAAIWQSWAEGQEDSCPIDFLLPHLDTCTGGIKIFSSYDFIKGFVSYDDNDLGTVNITQNGSVIFDTNSLNQIISVELDWTDIHVNLHASHVSYKRLNVSDGENSKYKKYIMELISKGFGTSLDRHDVEEVYFVTWWDYAGRVQEETNITGIRFQTVVVNDKSRNEIYILILYKYNDTCSDIDADLKISINGGSSSEYKVNGRLAAFMFEIHDDGTVTKQTKAIECEPPTPPLYGHVSFKSTTLGSEATYTCNCGTEGNFNNMCTKKTCNENDTWIGHHFECRADIDIIKEHPEQPDSSGIVNVCYNSMWRSVCDDYWTDVDANVACEHLGYLGFGAKATRKRAFNHGKMSEYWLDDVQCKGDEKSLFDCPRGTNGAKEVGEHNCGSRERAGVQCINTSDISIELVGKDCDIVELCYRGDCRSVCDNHWTNDDAKVACRELGLSPNGSKAMHNGKFDENEKVKYWLDFVDCNGTEKYLFSCDHLGLGRYNVKCDKGQRARVNCKDN